MKKYFRKKVMDILAKKNFLQNFQIFQFLGITFLFNASNVKTLINKVIQNLVLQVFLYSKYIKSKQNLSLDRWGDP